MKFNLTDLSELVALLIMFALFAVLYAVFGDVL